MRNTRLFWQERRLVLLVRMLPAVIVLVPCITTAGDRLDVRIERLGDLPPIVYGFCRCDASVLVGAETGVFEVVGDEMSRIAPKKRTGAVTCFLHNGDNCLIGTAKGLFDFDGGMMRRVAPKQKIGSVRVLKKGRNSVLVGTEKGLYAWKDEGVCRLTQDPSPHFPCRQLMWHLSCGVFPANNRVFAAKYFCTGLSSHDGDGRFWLHRTAVARQSSDGSCLPPVAMPAPA